MQNKTMSITLELAQAIANYLVTKPYSEVANLISELQRQASVTAEVPVEKPNEKPDKK